jgi:ribosomal protein S18 acetylase RimI-like enzyme
MLIDTARPETRTAEAGAVSVAAVDLSQAADRESLVSLLDEYARSPEGGAQALPEAVRSSLCDVLASRAHYAGWIARIDGLAAGLINCFEGVSTFRAKPLLNIHDIIVSAPFRRRGVARALLAAAERGALQRGCCKLTLEVLAGNGAAIAAYRGAGFQPYALDPAMGQALFFEKKFY